MAPIVLMAPLLAPIRFLNPTERRFLSSMVKSPKMIGHYYRYVAESADESKIEEVKSGAIEGYAEADKLSKTLNACNPIRLGLALNYSVF